TQGASTGEVEVGGQHAHHLARNVAEADRCADRAGIAMKQVLPQQVTQNRNVVVALNTILRDKRPALQCVHLENLKEIRNGGNRAGEARMYGANGESD